jgi:hypothetical protein
MDVASPSSRRTQTEHWSKKIGAHHRLDDDDVAIPGQDQRASGEVRARIVGDHSRSGERCGGPGFASQPNPVI